MLKCLWCGKEFEPARVTQKYCSSECRDRAKYEKRKEFLNSLNEREVERKLQRNNDEVKEVAICQDTTCRFNTEKRKNHCIALVDVDFKGSCPFYKEKRIRFIKKVEQ